jgi:hypothetical protein
METLFAVVPVSFITLASRLFRIRRSEKIREFFRTAAARR